MERLSRPFIVPWPVVGGIFGYVGHRIERDRRYAGHHEIGPALRATQLVVPLDVELVDVDLRITSRTARHT